MRPRAASTIAAKVIVSMENMRSPAFRGMVMERGGRCVSRASAVLRSSRRSPSGGVYVRPCGCSNCTGGTLAEDLAIAAR